MHHQSNYQICYNLSPPSILNNAYSYVMIRGEYKTKGSKPTHALMLELWRLNGKKAKATQSNTFKHKNNAEQPQ